MEDRPHFIPEVQSLRSIALILVAVYHVWFNRASGGLDVFLLISAYLITASVVRGAEAGRPFQPVQFLIRRFAGLFPLAATTALTTAGAAVIWLPAWRWESLFEELRASLFYYENRLLQERAVDYYAVDPAVLSPFQHFWSLSVQGQVFLLWALLHFAAFVAARVTKTRIQWWLLVGMTLLFVASLVFASWMIGASPERAYFDVRARLWEFAFGSLLALLPALAIPRPASRGLMLAGIALILTCGFALPVGTTFPGPAALWPLVGAGLVIVAARSRTAGWTPLSWRPLVDSGSYTYALYLVHWPVLVITQAVLYSEPLPPVQGTLVLAGSCLLAFLMTRFIDQPLQRLRKLPGKHLRHSAVQLVACVATACAVAWPVQTLSMSTAQSDSGVHALKDWAVLRDDCPSDQVSDLPCAMDTSTSAGPRGELVFVGNSHLQQYMATFENYAEQHRLARRSHLLPGCSYHRDVNAPGREALCGSLWDELMRGHLTAPGDTVVLLSTNSTAQGDAVPAGLESGLEELSTHGVDIITVRDNPRADHNVFACAEQLGADDRRCAFTVEGFSPLDGFDPPGTHLDFTDEICPSGECMPIRDGRHVYLDSHHLTASFARSLGSSAVDHQKTR